MISEEVLKGGETVYPKTRQFTSEEREIRFPTVEQQMAFEKLCRDPFRDGCPFRFCSKPCPRQDLF